MQPSRISKGGRRKRVLTAPGSHTVPLHLTDSQYDGCLPKQGIACDGRSTEIAWRRYSYLPCWEMKDSF